MYVYSKVIPQIAEPEILVVGAGSAGATAAIAAAQTLRSRCNSGKVMLVERYGFLGGTSTAILDTFYGFYTPGPHPIKVVGGIADEVVSELKRIDRVIERPNTFGAGIGLTYNSEFLKVVWEQLAKKAGVEILLHTFATDVIAENGRIVAVVVDGKAGLAMIRPQLVIDATGDADVCARMGVPLEKAGEIDPAQTLTTTFKLADVDVGRAQLTPRQDFLRLMREAADSGNYDLPRREGSIHITPINGVMATIMTRLSVVDATSSHDLTLAEIEGRRQALEYERFLRNKIPGFESARIVSFSTQIGVRESRRVCGDYRLTREDVLSAKRFEDVVGLCGAPMEDHQRGDGTQWVYLPEGKTVDIPYRTLVPRESSNLYVAGRCFSATHDAHTSVRSMAQCMAMGHAAGSATALCLMGQTEPRTLDLKRLQSLLLEQGAILDITNQQNRDAI